MSDDSITITKKAYWFDTDEHDTVVVDSTFSIEIRPGEWQQLHDVDDQSWLTDEARKRIMDAYSRGWKIVVRPKFKQVLAYRE